ncbi:Phosphate-induced protein [Parasponia andersonii]|uniref:Phosphate-induced protein n=1 Tax=Parasponia andersonii TaxID=3476 RepID=A0A2P5BF34_PARAD|nr:Phosphate-induced protein [Parasponia andersonii]
MASLAFSYVSLLLLVLSSCFSVPSIAAARMLSAMVQPRNPVLNYHNGPLLNGNVTVNILWYGKFSPSQRSILVDFVHSVGKQSTVTISVDVLENDWWVQRGCSYSRRRESNPRRELFSREITHDPKAHFSSLQSRWS